MVNDSVHRGLTGVIVALAAAQGCVAREPDCPPTINVDETLRGSAPDGWAAGRAELPKRLSGITLFDGHPERQAALAPTSDKRAGNVSIVTWRFSAPGSTWLACRYQGTGIELYKDLGTQLRSCSARYGAGGVLQSFACD